MNNRPEFHIRSNVSINRQRPHQDILGSVAERFYVVLRQRSAPHQCGDLSVKFGIRGLRRR